MIYRFLETDKLFLIYSTENHVFTFSIALSFKICISLYWEPVYFLIFDLICHVTFHSRIFCVVFILHVCDIEQVIPQVVFKLDVVLESFIIIGFLIKFSPISKYVRALVSRIN